MKTLHILVVDDNYQDIESLLKRHIAFENVVIETYKATNKESFRDILKLKEIDLVLSEYELNDYSGFNALRDVQASGCNIPFVFFAKSPEEGIVVESIKAGAWDVVAKERSERLSVTISNVLEGPAFRNPSPSLHMNEKFAMALQQSPSAIVIMDRYGKIEYVNDRFTEVTGYCSQEAVGSMISSSKRLFLPSESYTTITQTILSGNIWNGEFKKKKKDGTQYWSYVTISPVKDKKQDICNYIAVLNDITERKNLETELVKARNLADRSNQLKTVFLQNLSHEICTPLNAIVGFTSLLAEKNYNDDIRKDYMDIILSSSYQLLAIINDILTISRIQTGEQTINESSFNLQNTLNNLYSGFKCKAQEKGINLNLHYPACHEELIIVSDENKLNEILSNLLNNALKFTTTGSVDFGYEIKNHQLEFFVKDTGIGINEDGIGTIFDSFAQADMNTRMQYGGIGLGLAISKSFVELFGGKIWVKSEPKIGSEFYFTIPFFPSNSRKQNFRKETFSQNNTILVADDEYYNFILIKEMLRKYNLTLLHAPNGIEAIRICRERKDIKLLFMDIRMPEMGGLEAIKKIREFNTEVPVIAQTAFALEKVRNQILGCGFNGYLAKPIDRQALLEYVVKYIPGVSVKENAGQNQCQ